MKVLEDNIGENLVFEIDIFDYLSKAQSIKKGMTNWTSLKLKT